MDEGADDVDRLDVVLACALVEVLAQLRPDEREHRHGVLLVRPAQHVTHRIPVAHPREQPHAHAVVRELQQRRTNHPLGGLACRITYDEDGLLLHGHPGR